VHNHGLFLNFDILRGYDYSLYIRGQSDYYPYLFYKCDPYNDKEGMYELWAMIPSSPPPIPSHFKSFVTSHFHESYIYSRHRRLIHLLRIVIVDDAFLAISFGSFDGILCECLIWINMICCLSYIWTLTLSCFYLWWLTMVFSRWHPLLLS